MASHCDLPEAFGAWRTGASARLNGVGSDRHIVRMGAIPRHLYVVEVRPSREIASHFTWAIRDHGKLCRASYRPEPSDAQARAIAEVEVAQLLAHDVANAL